MKPVIITAATSRELALVTASLEGRERFHTCGREAFSGGLRGWPVIVAVTGIGKVNTAAVVSSLLERFEPELLINTGCSGAYPGSDLAVGDIAMASSEAFGDEGVVTRGGWHSLELIGIPAVERKGERFFNCFPLTQWAIDKAGYVAQATGVTLHIGRFVTVSTVSGTAEKGAELTARFGGICESMEGGAAVQVAALHGVDCLEIRGVSNMVEDRDLSRWDIALAVERVQDFILRFVGSLCQTC